MTLRYYKHCYRHAKHDVYVGDQQLQLWKAALSELLARKIDFGTDDLDESIKLIEWSKISRYGALRLAEGELIRIRQQLAKVRVPEIKSRVATLESEIENPRDLLSDTKNNLHLIWEEIDQLKRICAEFMASVCHPVSTSMVSYIPPSIVDYPGPEAARSPLR